MSRAAQLEIQQFEESEFRWRKVCESKHYMCKICGDFPMFDERELFFENDHVCAHCVASHERFMRD